MKRTVQQAFSIRVESHCIGCTECVDICPTHVLTLLSTKKVSPAHIHVCIGCAMCETTCPVHAIHVFKRSSKNKHSI